VRMAVLEAIENILNVICWRSGIVLGGGVDSV